ncbi:MAG: nucleotide exchange factor GrpE [Phycisphaerales bacterium]
MFGRKSQEPDPSQSPHGADLEPVAGDLAAQIASLTAERDDLNQKYLRALADNHNLGRRAASNEREAKQQGITSVALNVVTVLDHFDLALAQDPATATAAQIVSGVRVIRDELMRVLQNYDVTPIQPQPNDEFDPNRHQAVVQQPSDTVEPGRIVATLKVGYSLGERLIRPAMVSIRPKHEEPPAPGA